MTLVEVHPSAAEWNARIATTARPNMFQTAEMGRAKARAGWRPRFFEVGGVPVAVHEKKAPGLGLVWYVPKGPVVTDVDELGSLLPPLAAAARQAGAFLLPVARGQRRRRVGGPDAERGAAARHHVGRGVAPRRRQRIAAFRVPGVVGRTGDADEALDALDVAGQLGMADRPVVPDARQGAQPQVARVGAGAERTPVERRPTHAHARIVRAERGRRLPAAQPFLHPVDIGGGLVGDVIVGAKRAACLERDDGQASLRKPCCERCAS